MAACRSCGNRFTSSGLHASKIPLSFLRDNAAILANRSLPAADFFVFILLFFLYFFISLFDILMITFHVLNKFSD